MSWDSLRAVMELELPSVEKAVITQLAFHAGTKNSDECWPGVARLAKLTGLSERSVQRGLAGLEALGHISRRERPGKTPIYKVHPRHTFTPDTPSLVTEKASTPDTQSPEPLGTLQPPEPCGSAPKGAAPRQSMRDRSRKQGGGRLPTAWQPGDLPAELSERVKRAGEDWHASELVKFRNWAAAESGPKAFAADWQPRWQNWLLRGLEKLPAFSSPSAAPVSAPTIVQLGDGLDQFRRDLAAELGGPAYQAWFAKGSISRQGADVVIGASSAFEVDHIRTAFMPQMKAAARRAGIDPAAIAIVATGAISSHAR